MEQRLQGSGCGERPGTLEHSPYLLRAQNTKHYMVPYTLAGEAAVNEVEAIFAHSSQDSKLSMRQLQQLAFIVSQRHQGAKMEHGKHCDIYLFINTCTPKYWKPCQGFSSFWCMLHKTREPGAGLQFWMQP